MKDLLYDYLEERIMVTPKDTFCELFVIEDEYFGVRFNAGKPGVDYPVEQYIPYSSILAIHKTPSGLIIEIKTKFDEDNFLDELLSRL